MLRTWLVAGAAVLLLAGAPGTAGAKAPPKGTYECTISGTYFGTVTITGAKTYRRSGKAGKYTAKGTTTRPGGVRAYKIAFTTGPFKKFRGDWRKTTDGKYEIALRNPIDDFESIYCDK